MCLLMNELLLKSSKSNWITKFTKCTNGLEKSPFLTPSLRVSIGLDSTSIQFLHFQSEFLASLWAKMNRFTQFLVVGNVKSVRVRQSVRQISETHNRQKHQTYECACMGIRG